MPFRPPTKRSILPSESQVTSCSVPRRVGSSSQPVDRHDREELVDRPAVRQRLEEREVAEVAVDQRRLEVADDLGIRRLVVRDQRGQRVQRREVELLGVGPLAQREHAAGEQLLGALLGEDGVVEDSSTTLASVEPVEVLRHLLQQRVRLLRRAPGRPARSATRRR